jgi:FAD synthase
MTKEGIVIRGQGKHEKWSVLPTANIRQSDPRLAIGTYMGECYLDAVNCNDPFKEERLGYCTISIYATAPDIMEVYVCGFAGLLYDRRLTLKNIRKLEESDVRYYTDLVIETLAKKQ